MICPQCGESELAVLEKRDIEEGIRRRRLCQKCQHRFTTYERCEVPNLVVIKRDGRRETYDEHKTQLGMELACKNRPVQPDQISCAVAAITKNLRERNEETVSSNQIGDLVLEHLRQLDEIAYLRFVSVHRSFPDLSTFKREIVKLEKYHQPATTSNQ